MMRADPETLEKAFALVLREDYTVASSYGRTPQVAVHVSDSGPMEIDVMSTSNSRGRQPFCGSSNVKCFRWERAGHRAAPVFTNTAAQLSDSVHVVTQRNNLSQ